ncbi:MAG: hypothetical protein HN368_22260, partial [Spirochaetales bacterium]|nr:hypothetical protein [Spirochaetales bacterium]
LALLAVVDTANTRGVAVVGDTAYIVGSTGMTIVDITSRENPVEIGAYRTGYAEEVFVEGRLAFVAEGFSGLTIIDVADPTDLYTVSKNDNKYAVGIAVSGKYAYVVDANGLNVIEILIPSWSLRD